jgi:hypothetical protein
VKQIVARATGSQSFFDEPTDALLQPIHPGIGVGPAIGESGGVERAQVGLQALACEQERAGRHQEPQRELHRVHPLDESLFRDPEEELEIVRSRRPGRERDEGGTKGDPGIASEGERREGIGPVVPFFELFEHSVAERLDGRDDEETSEAFKLG